MRLGRPTLCSNYLRFVKKDFQNLTHQKGSPAVAGQKHGGEYAMGHVDVEAPTAAELKKAERKAARKAEKKAEKKVQIFTFSLLVYFRL